jgi:hypothetical protein
MTTLKITKEARRQFVRAKLQTNKVWALRALELIYSYQTSDEQEHECTSYRNDMGFNGADAEFLSSLAKQYETKKFLSDKQMIYVYKKIPKYAGQVIASSDLEKINEMIIASDFKVEKKVKKEKVSESSTPSSRKAIKDAQWRVISDFEDKYKNDNKTFDSRDHASQYTDMMMEWWGSNLVSLGIKDNEDGTFTPQFNVWD